MRQGEAELVGRIREDQGPDPIVAAFTAGTRLSRREATAAARDWSAAGAPRG